MTEPQCSPDSATLPNRDEIARIICCDGKCILTDTDKGCILNDPEHDGDLKKADKIIALMRLRRPPAPADTAALLNKWRTQAKQHDEAAEECFDRGDDDEGDMDHVEASALRRCADDLERLCAAAQSAWSCMGRKQALPEPAECNWPDCGCDPHATKVIESLLEQGWCDGTVYKTDVYEECAKLAEQASLPAYGTDARHKGREEARKKIAADIRQRGKLRAASLSSTERQP